MTVRHVAIVGAGVVGLAVADALLERDPDLTVTVVEQQDRCGAGASGFAGAIDIPYAHTPLHRELVRAGRQWWKSAQAEADPGTGAGTDAGSDADRARVALPFAWLVRDPTVAEELEQELVTPVRRLTGNTLTGDTLTSAALTGGAPAGGTAGRGWRLPSGTVALAGDAHVIDPGRMCALLLARLAGTGRARVVTGQRVEEVVDVGGGARLRTADGTVRPADRCVVAAGPWLPELAEGLGGPAVGDGVRTRRVYGLRLILAEPVALHQGVGSAEDGIFLFPTAGGEYAMSVRHDPWWDVPPAESPLPDEVLARAGDFLDELVGEGRWKLSRARVFADTYTPDTTPRVARFATGDSRFLVTGLHGSGVRLASGVAALTADAVLGGGTEG